MATKPSPSYFRVVLSRSQGHFVDKPYPKLKLGPKTRRKLRAKLMVEQDGRCAICGKPGELELDHSHKTGKHRGLLCPSCNRRLEFVDAYLPHIVRYLRRWQ